MSSDQTASLTPKSSAPQSFQIPEGYAARDEWRWVTEKTRWTFESRIKAVLLATFVTLMAHWLWRSNGGYFGYAMFVLVSAIVLYGGIRFTMLQPIASKGIAPTRGAWWLAIIVACIAIACARLIWQGNVAVANFAILLLGMLSIHLHGKSLAIGYAISRPLVSVFDGITSWIRLHDCIPLVAFMLRRWPWTVWGIPLMVSFLFLVPLTLAHPDLIANISEWTGEFLGNFVVWLLRWGFSETFVLACVAASSLGLLIPTMDISVESTQRKKLAPKPCNDLAFSIIRNTLISVIAVFSVFLLYEFSTLWFRTFPEDFHYPGYAHQGATWLTISLAMSTVTLSIMFRSSTHLHPNVQLLQRLAKFWCIGNLLLVIAVYHRLTIYVDYNGLTRMRIVGYVGVTCVLAGFVLVYCRVMQSRSLAWLFHRQLWAFAVSLFVLSVLPMDWIAHRWNASTIARGDVSPTVHIAAQPLSDEGLLCLVELVDSKETLVRNGVLALLANREMKWSTDEDLREGSIRSTDPSANTSWKGFQGATYLLRKKYDAIDDDLQPFRGSRAYQEKAWKEFHNWAMQWH